MIRNRPETAILACATQGDSFESAKLVYTYASLLEEKIEAIKASFKRATGKNVEAA